MRFVLVVAAALVLAPAASSALTPAAFRSQAGAACATAKAQLTASAKPMMTTTSILTNAQFEAYFASASPISQQEYAVLRALQPPASLVAPYRRALWDLWKLNALAADEVTKVRAGKSWIAVAESDHAKTMKLVKDWHSAWATAGVPACAGQGS
jgi:hypothetical protein